MPCISVNAEATSTPVEVKMITSTSLIPGSPSSWIPFSFISSQTKFPTLAPIITPTSILVMRREETVNISDDPSTIPDVISESMLSFP